VSSVQYQMRDGHCAKRGRTGGQRTARTKKARKTAEGRAGAKQSRLPRTVTRGPGEGKVAASAVIGQAREEEGAENRGWGDIAPVPIY